MDASHVCLVSIVWPCEKFKKYTCNEWVRVGVHIGNLLKLLKFSHKSDAVTFSLLESTSDHLVVTFHDEHRSAEFSLKLIAREDEAMDVPEFAHGADLCMDADEFSVVCKDLSNIADTLTLTVDATGLLMHASGDIGTATIGYDNLEMRQCTELTQSFALRYLNSFAKGCALASKVTLRMTQDMPLVIEYANDASYLTFYLAPKLDDDVDV